MLNTQGIPWRASDSFLLMRGALALREERVVARFGYSRIGRLLSDEILWLNTSAAGLRFTDLNC